MTINFILLAVFFMGVLLFATMNQKVGRRFNFSTPLDRAIPFLPMFSIPYLLLFPYIAFAGTILFQNSIATNYFAAMAFAMCAGAVSWYFFPSQMARPHVDRHTFFGSVVHRIYQGDTHANAFPSSHVFTSLITSYFLAATFPSYEILIWSIGIIIAASTVLIKQHFAVDVLAGALWAYAGIGVAHMFFA